MMKPPLKIVAMDPSLRNWGWVRAEYTPEIKLLTFQGTGVIKSIKATKADTSYKNLNDVRAASNIHTQLNYYLESHSPQDTLIISETPVGSQSAAAMKSYGICIGVLGSLAAQGYTIKHTRAREVQKFLFPAVEKGPSKKEMIDTMYTLYPWAFWPKTLGEKEHVADALASLHYVISDPSFDSWVNLKFILEE